MGSKLVFYGFIFLFSLGASASENDGSFTVYGMGSISCGKYSSFSKEGTHRKMAEQWIVGFLSGKNEEAHFSYETHERGYLEGLDYESVVKYVSNYCDNNPLDQLYNAVNNLNYELMQRHLSRQ